MATKTSQNYKLLLAKGTIDLTETTGDVIKGALMKEGFVFNQLTMDDYSTDISLANDECPTANGYTQGGLVLSGSGTLSRNDTLLVAVRTLANANWPVSTAPLTAAGLLLYDDTVTAKPIIGYIDFGGAQTTQVGGTFSVTNITIPIA